ncbi:MULTISPECIES: hypothetical protein [unclassified Pseudomonas]|uniref:hypothetical protein n=1 Tax=unclassified Pseudomonas TaxID=196821 RepID=UPI000C86AD5E|nr:MULTISPECIES: hypothetical protein [unclassified Pseudomonas]PMV87249.1 hypothetical protein C1X51_27895 [Pseudomonas sp. FW306-2-2C-B10A]PMV89845.1 hypothetical protein C1X56_02065 [Pseudomonas sp. GW101-1A09]PMW02995.1 hypothetical protein C1X55_00115 [Pseudomonas sp. GW460-C8]PMW07573.1 hypothetical protein C1X50_03075 [Pseudomonas sp. MPR-TSA4]PMW22466.1 hypothetical protein C1X52_01450 [Pseudomonas sp. FW306-2-1A-C05A]
MQGNVFQKGTLLIPTGGSQHLHIVMNDPLHCPVHGHVVVLLVNISTVYPEKYSDQTCILAPGSHPFILNDSWIVYRQAVVSRVSGIEDGILARTIHPRLPISSPDFDRVRQGFDASQDVPIKIKRFLRTYGL